MARREPNTLQRIINGLFGAFLGALIAFATAWYFDAYLVPFLVIGASICFLAAFYHGDRAIEWIIELGRWP